MSGGSTAPAWPRTARYALALLSCDLNEAELAFAMNWTTREARDFRYRIERLVGMRT